MPALPTLLAALAAAPGTLTAPAPASLPIPASEVRTASGEPAVVVRRAADGTVFALGTGDAAFAFTAPVARGRWPYRRWWATDVDDDGVTDLLGRDGPTLVLGRGVRAGGWAAPRRWATLPRRFAVVRAAAVDEDGYRGVQGLVALDPRTRETRVVFGASAGHSFDMRLRWPRGLTFSTARVNGDGSDDLVGVDRRSGVVRVAYNDSARFRLSSHRWRVPREAQVTAGDVDGDALADLLLRPPGTDAVLVRRAAHAGVATYRFRPARRAGRWDRRLPLVAATVGEDPPAALLARDPRTGRLAAAYGASARGAAR